MRHFVVLIGLLFQIFLSKADQLQECLAENHSTADTAKAGDNGYDDANFQWNIRKLINPLGFILVKSTEDVRIAVECLLKLNLKFRVKCGGNSIEKYSFGDNQTWIIDVMHLDSVEVDKNTNIATVGAGIRLLNLTEKLLKLGNYGLPVGSCYSVCVSGFTLGGGFGPASRKYGMMVDRLREMQVVTANARVITVNEIENSDLFWALRGGGGGNIGIVTSFKFDLFDVPQTISSVIKYYRTAAFPVAFNNYQLWLKQNPSDSIGILISYNGPLDIVGFEFIIYETDAKLRAEAEKTVKRCLREIKDADFERKSLKETLDVISTEYYKKGMTKFYYKTKSFFVSKYLNNWEIGQFANSLKKNKNVSFLLETYSGKINNKDRSETAFCHRKSLYVLQYGINSYDDYGQQRAIKEGIEMEKELNDFAKVGSFMSNGESYINYIDEDEANPFQKYYCENFERLREVKAKYDPNDVFKFPLSIPL